jgi:hypothetical protein
MLSTIAILMVGCFVVYTSVRALAYFTGGGSAPRVLPSPGRNAKGRIAHVPSPSPIVLTSPRRYAR